MKCPHCSCTEPPAVSGPYDAATGQYAVLVCRECDRILGGSFETVETTRRSPTASKGHTEKIRQR